MESKITVIVKDCKTQEGKDFKAYKIVTEKGRLRDLRFGADEDLKELSKCKKAIVTVEDLRDMSDMYEYPRFYGNGIKEVQKIY